MYTVTLQDLPNDVPDHVKNNAERTFQKALERSLGDADSVVLAYRAWQYAEDATEAELSQEDVSLIKRWMAAAALARYEGLREIGETQGPGYFEITIQRS